jgi:hypothetical protein
VKVAALKSAGTYSSRKGSSSNRNISIGCEVNMEALNSAGTYRSSSSSSSSGSGDINIVAVLGGQAAISRQQ